MAHLCSITTQFHGCSGRLPAIIAAKYDACGSKQVLYKWLCIPLLLWGVASLAHAAIDVYEFDTEEQRKRYQVFLEELRCPKCKNQNLAGTNSQIAEDLRRELHRMVVDGVTDEEIIDFMVTRYGDYVLYRPPVQKNTLFLWAGPFLFVFIGLCCVAWVVYRRRKFANSAEELTEQEQNQLRSMLSTEHSKKDNQQN